MALGLLALLTTVVGALYTVVMVVAGVVLAVIAIGIGIAALISKQRPLVLSVVGLASAGLSLVAAIIAGALMLGGTLLGAVGGGGTSGNTSDGAQAVRGIDAKWPANMAAGGVVFVGGDAGEKIVRSDAPAKGSVPVSPTREASGDNASNRIQLYVDYMCPACGAFEATNLNTLESVLAAGGTTIELRPLTFLDPASNGTYYSSRASGALACVANTEPELAWKTHTALLDPKNQPEEGTAGPDNKELIATLEDATGGLSQGTKSCISDEAFVPFAQKLSGWLLENPVPQATDSNLMVSGTPTVVVNGDPYTGSITDAAAFSAFLKAQGIKLK
jgi:protein-disulfide isomerase